MNKITGFLGTYASAESSGIYRFTIDLEDGSLSVPNLYYPAPDCKYLSLDGSLLASPLMQDGKAGICLLDTSAGTDGLDCRGKSFHEVSPACYVAQDSRRIYTANYHEGSVLIYEKSQSGPRLLKRIDIAPKAGCHQILFHSHFMLVPCLLLDSIRIFDCERDFEPAGEIRFRKGTGPRHGVFDKDHSALFLLSELSNEIYVFPMGSFPSIEPANVYPILPEGKALGEPPASAAIRLSPDGRFLYASTRFADVITVFQVERPDPGLDAPALRQIQQVPSGGVHPRDFALAPDGRFLLAANRTSGGLVCFPIDQDSGRLQGICSRVPAPEAVSVVLAGPGPSAATFL